MRASEKKIIYVRDTGSKIFEEAYFVIRPGISNLECRPSENDMVREATRIVNEGGREYPDTLRRSRTRTRIRAFLSGAATAGALIGGAAWLIAAL